MAVKNWQQPRNLQTISLPQPDLIDQTYWEKLYWSQGFSHVAGLDEAGRGALAGPVVAAAVVLKPGSTIPGVDDSKKLTPKKREILFDVICHEALSYGVGIVSSRVIDDINILKASLSAMVQAVSCLNVVPDMLLVDGNQKVNLTIPQKTLVQGDHLSLSIGAASILAKVTRDRLMTDLEAEHVHFRFSQHKGYGTQTHLNEIKTHGVLPIHRRSFEPIRSLINPPLTLF